MYKVFPVEGGWRVFFVEEGQPPRLADSDGRLRPYVHRTHAHRRARQLNRALMKIETRIAEHGAVLEGQHRAEAMLARCRGEMK